MSTESRLIQNQGQSYAETLYYVTGQIFRTRNPADRVLAAHFRKNRKFGSRDRRFMSETFFSVFRWWGWLSRTRGITEDFWDDDPATASRLKPWLRILLGAHLLDNDDMHPVAVYWKECLGYTGYLKACREASLEQKGRELSELLGLPALTWQELVPRWIFAKLPLAEDQRKYLVEQLQERPPMWLRCQGESRDNVLNALRHEDLKAHASPHLPDAIRIDNAHVNLYELDAYRNGHFEIQDFASQVIGYTCAPQAGERWWDACAGAGGKTLQLASLMRSKGTVLATDIREYKLNDLKKRARRPGLSNIRTKPWDGHTLPTRNARFDGVLVDAPCSNTGTWRRNPDARWTLTPDDVQEMATMQLEILERVAPAVEPGGKLLYATCSLCRDENEDVVQAFLARHPEYRLDKVRHPVTKSETDGMLRIWPADSDCDGMFVARLIRKS